MSLLRSTTWRPIPPSRRMVCEVLRYDRQVPTVAHDRKMDLAELRDARERLPKRISWPALFLKAYALTAKDFPRLRQTWMRWPWPHLHEHPEDIGNLVVHRRFEDDDWLFWGRMRDLHRRPLPHIQVEIDDFQTCPIEKHFGRQVWLAKLPGWMRRLAWWHMFHWSGRKRCTRLGTFFLSTIAGHGAEIQNPPSMFTSGLTYGPLDDAGCARVTLTYDHRLLDGYHVGDILQRLESTLQGPIAQELASLSHVKLAA